MELRLAVRVVAVLGSVAALLACSPSTKDLQVGLSAMDSATVTGVSRREGGYLVLARCREQQVRGAGVEVPVDTTATDLDTVVALAKREVTTACTKKTIQALDAELEEIKDGRR